MAIVLVPGFMLDDDLWADIIPFLKAFGPALHISSGAARSIEEMARNALSAAPERFALIGFSMGGYVAREMVRMAEDRVTKLVLIATSSRGDTDLQAQRKLPPGMAGSFAGVSRRSVRQSLAPDREQDTALVDRIHAMSVRLGGDVFIRQAGFYRQGDTARLSEIRCPTLIVAGEHDRLRSLAEARELQQNIPGAELVTLPTGHMIPLEDAEGLGKVLAGFLHG